MSFPTIDPVFQDVWVEARVLLGLGEEHFHVMDVQLSTNVTQRAERPEPDHD